MGRSGRFPWTAGFLTGRPGFQRIERPSCFDGRFFGLRTPVFLRRPVFGFRGLSSRLPAAVLEFSAPSFFPGLSCFRNGCPGLATASSSRRLVLLQKHPPRRFHLVQPFELLQKLRRGLLVGVRDGEGSSPRRARWMSEILTFDSASRVATICPPRPAGRGSPVPVRPRGRNPEGSSRRTTRGSLSPNRVPRPTSRRRPPPERGRRRAAGIAAHAVGGAHDGDPPRFGELLGVDEGRSR